MRVLRSTALTVNSPTFVGADDETPAATASTPVAAVTREDGTSLTAAVVSGTPVSTGVYAASITTTHTSQLDRLKVTWSGTAGSLAQVYTTELEVVGAHYVTLPEIRGENGLDNTTTFPLAQIRRVRDKWANRVEDACGVAFVPRYERDVLCGDGTSRLALSRIRPLTLISVTIDGTSQTLTNFSLHDAGVIEYEGSTFPVPSGAGPNVTVVYEHGFPNVPDDIKDEVLKAIRMDLLRSKKDLPTDAISQAFPDGPTIRYSTPGPGRPTGVLSLDAVLMNGYMFRPPAVG